MWKCFIILCLSIDISRPASGEPADSISAGPLYDEFRLTLSPGHRTEALGPFFSREQKESQHQWAVPPLFSHTIDPETDFEEFDLAYPLLTYDRFGEEYRFQFLQLLNFPGGRNQDENSTRRFTLFPIYFQQRSSDPALNYTAVFPFYGKLRNRLFRSEIDFLLWPLYARSKRRPAATTAIADDPFLALPHRYQQAQRGDLTTYNFMYPFFHLRYGEGLEGWQLWPLSGCERKEITTKTNEWDEVETIPGHKKRFVLWPFFFDWHREIGSDNPEHQQVLLPFYSSLRSPQRDSTSYGLPLFSFTDDRARKYREWGAPWPFIVVARGEGKTTTRIWPLFSRAHNTNLQSDFYLWPVYKYNRLQAEPLDRERTRILFFLYSKITEKNTETGDALCRKDLWPLFTHRRDFDGNERLQVLSVLEPFLPHNKSLERNYSPLWSLWRSETNAATRATSQSLLWNLYRREATPDTRKCSLFFGLFQYQSSAHDKRWRLFYVPFGKAESGAKTPSRP